LISLVLVIVVLATLYAVFFTDWMSDRPPVYCNSTACIGRT
jgi:hypothetical protein